MIVRCVDRRPQRGDFDAGTVEQLSLRQVILEIWGNVQPEERGGVKGYVASLEYILIPARVNELGGRPPRSFYTSQGWQKAAALPEEIQKFFSADNDLGLYTHVAVGMNSLEKKKYDDAFQFLCRAQILLGKKGAQRPNSPLAELSAYVRNLTTETFQTARQDPSYSGWMKQLVTGSQAPACRAGGN